jgi:GT2 family glycosyltransferase
MNSIDISVCIVNYQARDYLAECIRSITKHTEANFEIIVVDNGSQDGTIQMLQQDFPDVKLIANDTNQGFTRPMNQALKAGNGRYLLQLNPDTLVMPAALDYLIDFLKTHPEVGICGPKVLNRDGSLQKPCRRGESTPWAAITYFFGLAKLFPQSKTFGQYLMSYMDENETHPVAGVSGSCMLIRRAVVEQIGYLDEDFFAYQEDADYCFRARQAGWRVFYYPEAQVIHYGGKGGSRVQPFRSIYEWHRSYYLYYHKNLAKNYFFLFNWIYYLAMALKLGLSLVANLFRKEKIVGSRKP